jgi:hypothetical protein
MTRMLCVIGLVLTAVALADEEDRVKKLIRLLKSDKAKDRMERSSRNSSPARKLGCRQFAVGDHTGVADAQLLGADVGLLAAGRVCGPLLGQV